MHVCQGHKSRSNVLASDFENVSAQMSLFATSIGMWRSWPPSNLTDL